jgi:hypothetical protein
MRRFVKFTRCFTLGSAAVLLLSGCAADPAVVNVEAVASARFHRDLDQCTAAVGQALFASWQIRHCMESRGHRFLRHG